LETNKAKLKEHCRKADALFLYYILQKYLLVLKSYSQHQGSKFSSEDSSLLECLDLDNSIKVFPRQEGAAAVASPHSGLSSAPLHPKQVVAQKSPAGTDKPGTPDMRKPKRSAERGRGSCEWSPILTAKLVSGNQLLKLNKHIYLYNNMCIYAHMCNLWKAMKKG
jgi:hypothetical protein